MKPLIKIILPIIIVLCISQLQAQGTDIYYNEKYQQIEKRVFLQKLKSKLFMVASFQNDTAKIHKLRFKEFFGTVDSTKHQQLKIQFARKYGLNPKKQWFIHYIDTLPNAKKMPSRSGLIFINTETKDSIFVPKGEKRKDKIDHTKYKGHIHVTNLKDYAAFYKKELSEFKLDSEFIHIYDFDKGFDSELIKELKFIQDHNHIIKRVFSDGFVSYKVIILNPSGEFYVSRYDDTKRHRKLLKGKAYSREKKRWLKRIIQLGI